jgi:ferrochelatase
MEQLMDSAVLMMAYGGPGSLADVEPYLLDVRGGRPTSPELLEQIRSHYAQIGGRSPLLEITRAQAAALEARLNAGQPNPASDAQGPGERYRVYVGMRHWHPYIGEAVMQIVRDGFRRVVGLCMAPHYSSMSIGAYYAKVDQARQALDIPLEVIKIEDWHDHPLFVQALAERVRAAQTLFPGAERDRITYLFTAHSLPSALIEQGDPYDGLVRATAQRLAGQLGLAPAQWQMCYQSAGATGARWLGPAVEDVIVEMADSGRHSILVVPIGFVADHVEILFDLDIECRAIAQARGVHLERIESLNTTPTFIEALAALVRAAATAHVRTEPDNL